jgi:DNA-binding NtrC family response regulator
MPESARPDGPSILIVEDSFLISRELSAALEAAGYRIVGPAASVEGALECIDGDRPDMAILDVELSGTLAIRVAECLSARGIPFVVATGYAQEALPRAFGNALYVGKPFLMRSLLDLLDRLTAPSRGAAAA